MTKQRISGAAICYEKLDKADKDQIVTIDWMRKGHEDDVSEGAAYNVTWVLSRYGALRLIGGTGMKRQYQVIRAKLAKYFNECTPYSPYFQARKKRNAPARKIESQLQKAAKVATPESNIDDVEVIDNLLDAMAAAEQVLNKIKRIAEAMHS